MKNDKLQSSMKTIKNTFFLGIVCAASVVSSVAHELEANEKYPGKSVKAQTRKEIVTFFLNLFPVRQPLLTQENR